MLGSLVSNLRSHSNRLTESISVENFKLRASETYDNLKSNLAEKTSIISMYLKDTQSRNGPSRTVSTPNFKTVNSTIERKPSLKWPCLIDNKMVWVNYDTYQNELEEEDSEPDIVDKFVRVISIGNENSSHYNRRNDREEIRRRLATGDNDDYYGSERPGKKPSLQARLQSGMNLQICFMNETSSDTESPSSESAPPASQASPPTKTSKGPPEPPKSLILPNYGRTRNINSTGSSSGPASLKVGLESGDFFSKQARLQTEARLALAQAKDRARLQMEAERHRSQTSPITQMLKDSLNKVGIKFPEDRRRLSRQMLTDMNIAQLQVIVNDLHTQIEILNEGLVKFLMERDELHMSQDSMLVDIEDVTRYLGAKESLLKDDIVKNNNNLPEGQAQPQQPRPVITRIVNLGKK